MWMMSACAMSHGRALTVQSLYVPMTALTVVVASMGPATVMMGSLGRTVVSSLAQITATIKASVLMVSVSAISAIAEKTAPSLHVQMAAARKVTASMGDVSVILASKVRTVASSPAQTIAMTGVNA